MNPPFRRSGRAGRSPDRSSGRRSSLVRHRERDREAVAVRRDVRHGPLNGPIPASASRPDGQHDDRPATTPPIAMPCTCVADESRRPSGLHRSHSPTSIATGAPHRTQAWVSSGLAARRCGRRFAWRWCTTHDGDQRTSALPAPGGPTGRRRRRSCGPARWRRRRRPPASAAHVSRGAWTHGLSTIRSSLSQSPWNPTITRWSSRPPGRARAPRGRRGRFGSKLSSKARPAVPDPPGQPRARGGLAADDDRRRRDRDRVRGAPRAAGSTANARVTGPPVHSARMTATASSSRATRSGASGKSMPYAACSCGAPPIPMPRTSRPTARDLERRGHPRDHRRVAVHDVEHEWRRRSPASSRRPPWPGSSSPRRPGRSGRPCP